MKPGIFVTTLEDAGFSPFMGIPCSVLKPLLDYIADSNSPTRNYLCSSEGDAMGLAAGFSLSGRLPVVYMQNDGYGNAVNPLSSLYLLYKLPVLLLISWRGEPGVKDAPQHAVMGKTILLLLDTFEIPHIVLDNDEGNLKDSVAKAKNHCTTESKPFAFVIRKGYFDRHSTSISQSNTSLNRRLDYIRLLSAKLQPNDVLLGTTGFSGREMYQTVTHKGKFYMMGSMGCLASLGMGALATVGYHRPGNLIHVCFDNRSYESTGGQPTLSTAVNLLDVAEACGYPTVNNVKTIGEFEAIMNNDIEISPGTEEELTRPPTSPEEMRDCLRAFLQ
ncbi:MAG: hypothetical protein JRI56_12840 [Deltaproteobacteria bacterium]|nr:hypothetical protein [Deltaproteobacteria bacterium]